MPSKLKMIATRLEDADIKKIEYIAEKEHRSISNLLQIIIKKEINKFEAEHGEIKID